LWGYSSYANVRTYKDSIDERDNALAVKQMQLAYETLLSRKATTQGTGKANTKTGRIHPRIVTLGGDHSIVPAISIATDLSGPAGPSCSEQDLWSSICCAF